MNYRAKAKFYCDQMIENGFTLPEGCQLYGLSDKTLRGYCREFGHIPLRKKKYTDFMLTNLYERVKSEGCSQAAVCGGDRQLEKALSRFVIRVNKEK